MVRAGGEQERNHPRFAPVHAGGGVHWRMATRRRVERPVRLRGSIYTDVAGG
jgi:hypothetical protein